MAMVTGMTLKAGTVTTPAMTRRKRWTLILLGAGAVLLVPWTVVLALTLPGDTEVRHWSLAWIGLDVLMAAGCAGTALLGLRGDPRARLTASATASAAVLDAWFDITTAQAGTALAQALACAVAEATLAGVCAYLALSRRRLTTHGAQDCEFGTMSPPAP
ncbi:hypothetical protein [Streptomyces sp. NK08204]|uniref:hypothetical protein n=1 Tax=Streptomyces sp. NK08204 TaxID=2873260 RepID=UPI001CED2EAD|nr:hypothetical protein [Streptomyces sp. NK08204]